MGIIFCGEVTFFYAYVCATAMLLKASQCGDARAIRHPTIGGRLLGAWGLVIIVVKRSANCIIPLVLFLRLLLIISFYSIRFVDCFFPWGFRKLQLP